MLKLRTPRRPKPPITEEQAQRLALRNVAQARLLANFREEISSAGIRHQDVADKCGVSRAMVSRALSGTGAYKSSKVINAAWEMLQEARAAAAARLTPAQAEIEAAPAAS